MHFPNYTEDEDRILLSYTADLDPDDYENRIAEFTLRFKQASMRLPGRNVDALRKRYKRLQSEIKTGKREAQTPTKTVATTPYQGRKTASYTAKSEPIDWDNESFIRPPSRDRLMAGR